MALLVHPRGRGRNHIHRDVSGTWRFSQLYLENKWGSPSSLHDFRAGFAPVVRASLSTRCMQHDNQKRSSDIHYSQQHAPHGLRAQGVHLLAQQAQQSR